MTNMASDKQLDFIDKLMEQRQVSDELIKSINNSLERLRSWRASEIINELLALPMRERQAKKCEYRRCDMLAKYTSPFPEATARLCPIHYNVLSSIRIDMLRARE